MRTDDTDPLLSPDGTRVVYSSRRGAVKGLYVKDLNGTAGPELLVEDGFNKAPQAWSADGKLVMYSAMSETTSYDLWAVPVASDHKPVAMLQTKAAESRGELSPDGRFLAYASTESGRSEVYIARFPLGGTKWPVSSTGGTNPHWRRDGKELFFPGKVSGAWVLRNTRMPVATIFENLEAGANIDDILAWYDGLDREQVKAVIEFAARSLDTPVASR